LYQLSFAHPPDAAIRFTSILDPQKIESVEVEPCEGLTLIMACRSRSRADAARDDLFARLDKELERRRQEHGPDAHAARFRANLKIEFLYADLALLSSVFMAAQELSKKYARHAFCPQRAHKVASLRYPYISHLICNAGLTSFTHINFPAAILQILRGFVNAVTLPRFNVANIGERSVDGLGWVWQCNIFSHFALVRPFESPKDPY
jgi:3-keto steroid reductase